MNVIIITGASSGMGWEFARQLDQGLRTIEEFWLIARRGERLRELSGLPVVLWDERSTTVSAIGILNTTDTRGKKRKAVVDAVAATLILESYLAYRKNHPED